MAERCEVIILIAEWSVTEYRPDLPLDL